VKTGVGSYDQHEADATGPYFDAEYYLRTNQDVREAGVDPLKHFLTRGWREGRNPSREFDVAFYLRRHQDVAAAGINPLLHYAYAGKSERRLTQRPMNALRACVEGARHPRNRAGDWAVAADRSPCLERELITQHLAAAAGCEALIVSISHDDYQQNLGGVQNVVRQERDALVAAGCAYLHLSPASPLPMLAEPMTDSEFRVRMRLGSDLVGVATICDVVMGLEALRASGARIIVVVHHLLGHAPEALEPLAEIATHGTIVWIHDYFTLCSNFSLLRNDVRFCGAPRATSEACCICVYGVDRAEHGRRIRRFFEAAQPLVLAPSETALEVWRSGSDLPCRSAHVQPLARLVLASEPLATGEPARPLRVAHLGMRVHHKGWLAFEELALRFGNDPGYAFYQLGTSHGAPLCEAIRNIEVLVNRDRPEAMVEAVAEHRIDVVLSWSPWPETFCYTVHEALAGGAFVLANAGAGHVAAALRRFPDQACVLGDDAELFRLFEEDRLARLVSKARRRRGVLIPEFGSAQWIARLLERRASISSDSAALSAGLPTEPAKMAAYV
jgi:hypothetical protein